MMQNKFFQNPLARLLILSSCFFIIFLLISGGFFLRKSSLVSPGHIGSSSFFGRGAVGIIEIEGVILDSKKTLARLERFEEDDQIKAVVLRINSPGGSVAPSQEIYEAVKNYKKPVVVSMASVAASGAYYIASAAQKIFANAGTMTGSIGVIMEFANLEKLYDWAKIQRYSIKTGKFKDAGSEYRALTPEERKLFQVMVDDILRQFKEAVAAGRNLTMEQVSEIADGRVFSGHQALEAHLVDELGTLHDAVQEAGKLAHLEGKPKVITIENQRRKWWDFLMDDSPESEGVTEFISGSRGLESMGAIARWFFPLFQGGSERVTGTHLGPGVYWIWGGAR